MPNIGPVQLLIVLLIVAMLFGTKKLRNVGSDLGEAIKGFKKGLKDGEEKNSETESLANKTSEAQAQAKENVSATADAANGPGGRNQA